MAEPKPQSQDDYSPLRAAAESPDSSSAKPKYRGLLGTKRSRPRALLSFFVKWLLIFVLIMAVYATLLGYSKRDVMNTKQKREFNAIITGLLISLSLSTVSILASIISDLRWYMLSSRHRSPRKVEAIYHAHSMRRLVMLAVTSRRPSIHIFATLWVLITIGVQIALSTLGLCYSIENSESVALFVDGNVTVPDISADTSKVVKEANSLRALQYTANSYGTISLGAQTDTLDNLPSAGRLWYSDDPLYFSSTGNDSTCAYVFQEVNTASLNNPSAIPVTVRTNRNANVTANCAIYRVVEGGDGSSQNITIDKDGQRFNVSLPMAGGRDQTTYFTDTTVDCGEGCAIVSSFEASGSLKERSTSSWFYNCTVVVNQVANANRPEHRLDDGFRKRAASAIALQGYLAGTLSANQTNLKALATQYVIYPSESIFGAPRNGSLAETNYVHNRFAIGVVGVTAENAAGKIFWGKTPIIGVRLKVEHWNNITVIFVVTGAGILILGLGMTWLAAGVVAPRGGPVHEAQVFKSMMEDSSEKVGEDKPGRFQKGSDKIWIFRQSYVGDGLYDLYMESAPRH